MRGRGEGEEGLEDQKNASLLRDPPEKGDRGSSREEDLGGTLDTSGRRKYLMGQGEDESLLFQFSLLPEGPPTGTGGYFMRGGIEP